MLLGITSFSRHKVLASISSRVSCSKDSRVQLVQILSLERILDAASEVLTHQSLARSSYAVYLWL